MVRSSSSTVASAARLFLGPKLRLGNEATQTANPEWIGLCRLTRGFCDLDPPYLNSLEKVLPTGKRACQLS